MKSTLGISVSGMIAQRTRMNVIAANIANADTLYNARGEVEPFRRRIALLSPGMDDKPGSPGVRVAQIALDSAPFRKEFDPTNPAAAKVTDPSRDLVKGYVNYPNIDTSAEMINAIEATRAYEANIAAAEATKSMMAQALRLIA